MINIFIVFNVSKGKSVLDERANPWPLYRTTSSSFGNHVATIIWHNVDPRRQTIASRVGVHFIILIQPEPGVSDYLDNGISYAGASCTQYVIGINFQ